MKLCRTFGKHSSRRIESSGKAERDDLRDVPGLADIFSQVAKTNRFGSCSGMRSSHGERGDAVAVHGIHVACGSVRVRTEEV